MAKKSKFKEIPPYRITSGLGGYKADDAAVTIGGKILPDNIEAPTIRRNTTKRKNKVKLIKTQVYDKRIRRQLHELTDRFGLGESAVYRMSLLAFHREVFGAN